MVFFNLDIFLMLCVRFINLSEVNFLRAVQSFTVGKINSILCQFQARHSQDELLLWRLSKNFEVIKDNESIRKEHKIKKH